MLLVEMQRAHPELALLGQRALNLLEETQLRELEAHLCICPCCQQEATRLQELVDILPYAAPLPETPEHLRVKILARIENQTQRQTTKPRGSRWVWPLSCTLLGMLLAGWYLLVLRTENVALARHLSVVEQAVRAGAEPVPLKVHPDLGEVHGNLYVGMTQLFLTVTGLAPAPEKFVYAVWVETGRGLELAGTFDVNRAGKAGVILNVHQRPSLVQVTLEEVSQFSVGRPVVGVRAPQGQALLHW